VGWKSEQDDIEQAGGEEETSTGVFCGFTFRIGNVWDPEEEGGLVGKRGIEAGQKKKKVVGGSQPTT